MAERNYPREWLGLLPAETARWVQEGLISEEQRSGIMRLYPNPAASNRDRTVLLFSILGSLLVGAGVILFFAANWAKIPAAVKVGVLMTSVVGTYWAGYQLQFVRGDYPRLGHSLIFLGSILYGANIWLLAQIFHLESHYPNGFLLWALGILPLVWATRSRPVLYLAMAALTVWSVLEQAGFDRFNYFYPALLLAVVLPLARRAESALVEAGVLSGLFLWFVLNIHLAASYEQHLALVARLMMVYGACIVGGGLARVGDERAYVGVGALLTLLGTYLMTFEHEHPGVGGEPAILNLMWGGPAYVTIGVWTMLAGVGVAAWLYWRRAEPGRLLLLPVLIWLAVAPLRAGIFGPVAAMAAFNLLLFGETVGVIALGVHRRSGLLVNMGLAAFAIHLITRYFDLFFTAMNKSLFFVLGGVLLLGGGWLLERNRRRWTREWGGGSHVA